MQKRKKQQQQRKQLREIGRKQKRETGNPESLCQAGAQMAGYRHGIFVADG
jgi:hypothetical protein